MRRIIDRASRDCCRSSTEMQESFSDNDDREVGELLLLQHLLLIILVAEWNLRHGNLATSEWKLLICKLAIAVYSDLATAE